MSNQSRVKNCEPFEQLIEALLDGDLEAHQEDSLHLHLESCARCREGLSLAGAIQQELRALPEPDAPQWVLQAILDRPEAGPWNQRLLDRLRALLPAPAWAALATAAALIALFMLIPTTPGPPEPLADAQVAQATEEARIALAFVGGLSRQAGKQLRDDILVGKVVVPTTRALAPQKANPPATLDSNGRLNSAPPGARS